MCSMRARVACYSVFLWVALFTSLPCGASQAIPPEREDAIGVWIGYSDHGEFVRLELTRDSRGYLTFGRLVDGFDTYRVRAWTLKDWSLSMDLLDATPAAEGVKCDKVRFCYSYIEVEFSGDADLEWSRKVTLYNERTLKQNAKGAKRNVSTARKMK